MVLDERNTLRIRAMIDGGLAVNLDDVLGAAQRARDVAMSEDEFLREIESRARRRIAIGPAGDNRPTYSSLADKTSAV